MNLNCTVIVSIFLELQSNSSNCNCGWRNSGRIVSGRETRQNEYPWMVALKLGRGKGGGSIITDYHVLTAAHCTNGLKPHQIKIWVGKHNISNPSEGVKHSVAKIIQHDYQTLIKKNDISVVVTKRQIKFNQNVGPVCLPGKRFNLVGKEMKVMGWGRTEGTGNKKILHEVDLAFVPLDKCQKFYPRIVLTETQICVYGYQKSPCKGDSGGPLIYLNPDDNRYYQVALVSFGKVGCRSEDPSVSTDVFAFSDWINAAISGSMPGVRACTGN